MFQIQFTEHSTTKTILRILDGRPLYHIDTPGILTRKTTTIYKIPENSVQKYLDAEKMVDVTPDPQNEMARIHWHSVHDTRVVWDGRTYDIPDILQSVRTLSADKSFMAPNGKKYRWRWTLDSSIKLTLEDGPGKPPVVAKMRQWSLIRRKKPIIEVDESLESFLDLVIITLIYMETRRRDTELTNAVAAAAAA